MELEKFKRYIGKPIEIELEAEDGTKEIFELKPLPLKMIPEMLLIGKSFAKVPMDAPGEKFLECLDEDTTDRMRRLVEETLKRSYPELPQDLLDQFGAHNFMPLVSKIFEINNLGGKADLIQEKLKQMRQKQ